MSPPLPITTRLIRRYYDQNTSLFLALGSSPRAYTIHRSVWAPGVATLDEALDYTNGQILAEIRSLACAQSLERLRLADLGCGVGGTLFSLLPRLPRPAVPQASPALALGLTLSPVQARLARQRAARLGLLDRVHFIEADFQALPLPTGFDLAWSVEAFLHAEDPACYFRQAARLLRTGGRLILCDDFLAEGLSEGAAPRAFQPRAASWLGAFHQGWHAPGLRSAAQVERLAGESGLRLVRNTDLTPHLRLRVLPDRLARAILAFGRRLPLKHAILPSMLGSLALQQCLRYGWIEYRFLVFEK